MTRSLSRRELKRDELVTVMDRLLHWLSRNWRILVGIGVAIVVAVLVAWAIIAWQSSRRERASELLASVVDVTTLEPTAPAAGAGDVDRAETLEEISARFGGTPQGAVARLLLAQEAMDAGDEARARELLEQVSDRGGESATVRAATLALVRLRIAAGELEEVRADLQGIVAGGDDRLPRDLALWELAGVAEEMGDTEAARTHLQTLVDEVPDSPWAAEARQKLQTLG